ncbi:unnamed protein product [Timema podura]|uniref:Uncharacterized protein n=1 Tax=Timema podura TaxID=61482 RepID=A0ABN7PTU3_TIMPD|nr:unnamed protein product [Timema podura]
MFGAMLLVIIKGTLDIGGISVVWERNFMSGRIEAPNFELSMMTRHTFWVLMFGGFAMWLQSNAVNQSQLQRYLSLPTLTSANR